MLALDVTTPHFLRQLAITNDIPLNWINCLCLAAVLVFVLM